MIAAVQHQTTNNDLLFVVGILVGLAMILVFLLVRRDREVGRTKIGFFVERTRHDRPERPWPELRHTTEYELPPWLDKTAEQPTQEKKPDTG